MLRPLCLHVRKQNGSWCLKVGEAALGSDDQESVVAGVKWLQSTYVHQDPCSDAKLMRRGLYSFRRVRLPLRIASTLIALRRPARRVVRHQRTFLRSVHGPRRSDEPIEDRACIAMLFAAFVPHSLAGRK